MQTIKAFTVFAGEKSVSVAKVLQWITTKKNKTEKKRTKKNKEKIKKKRTLTAIKTLLV